MRVLIVLAKAPLAGFAKTRLARAPGLNEAAVAQLADAFLRDTVHTCRRAGPARLWLCFTPPTEHAYFRELDAHAELVPQCEGDLGARIRTVFADAFAAGAERVVALGADTPHLHAETIAAAFASLERERGVLGPSSDGGYYLLGLRERCDALFEGIAWSTAAVARETSERARSRGWEFAQLDEMFDVDDARDLERLRELLARDPQLAPHTFAALRALQRSAS